MKTALSIALFILAFSSSVFAGEVIVDISKVRQKLVEIQNSKHGGCKRQLLDNPNIIAAQLTGMHVERIDISEPVKLQMKGIPFGEATDIDLFFVDPNATGVTKVRLNGCQIF